MRVVGCLQSQSESIGFTLVETLVQQLGAAYEISSTPGAGTDMAKTFEKSEMKGSGSTNVLR